MSTETPRVDGGSSVHPYDCENAKEYAIERLREADNPVKAAELASEYECSPGHMRDVLRKASEVKRVSRGLYALSTENDASESDTEIERPSADGPVPSLVIDGTDGGPGDGEDEDLECPVEGCDYEGDDLLALRGHANSMMDHDWEEVRNEIEKDDMDTEEAIELQRGTLVEDDRDEQDNTEGKEIVEEMTETTQKGIPLPVSSTVLIVAVVVAIAALWLFTRDGSNSEPERDQQNQQDDIFGDGRGLI